MRRLRLWLQTHGQNGKALAAKGGRTQRVQAILCPRRIRVYNAKSGIKSGIIREIMNSYTKSALLASFLIFFLFSTGYAESESEEGYDENTEITVKGTVREVVSRMRGPVTIILKSGKKDYRVVTAPPWYIAREGIEFKAGTFYEVTGSIYIARDGNLYIVASRLKNLSTGMITPLRDSSCMPLWKGRRMMRGFSSEH